MVCILNEMKELKIQEPLNEDLGGLPTSSAVLIQILPSRCYHLMNSRDEMSQRWEYLHFRHEPSQCHTQGELKPIIINVEY